MCGIVGYIGHRNAYDVIIKGLKRLEYRGYDSAGITLLNGSMNIYKKAGKVSDLENFAEGKALDLMQTAALNGFDTRISGSTNDYSKTAGSDVVVITSGIPRKPGMSRDDLIATNAGIVKSVTENVIKYSPNAIIISRVDVFEASSRKIPKRSSGWKAGHVCSCIKNR